MKQADIIKDILNRIEIIEKDMILFQRDAFNKSADEVNDDRITKDQLEDLYHELADYPVMTKTLLRGLGVDTLADTPRDKYRSLIEFIRKQKNVLANSSTKEW